MKAYEVGQQVKAVRGRLNTMNPAPCFVGKVGRIVRAFPPLDGEVYYAVEFDSGYKPDFIDHCNLEVV